MELRLSTAQVCVAVGLTSVWGNVVALAWADVAVAETVGLDSSKTGIPGSSGLPFPVGLWLVCLLLPQFPSALLYVLVRVACVPFPTGQLFV